MSAILQYTDYDKTDFEDWPIVDKVTEQLCEVYAALNMLLGVVKSLDTKTEEDNQKLQLIYESLISSRGIGALPVVMQLRYYKEKFGCDDDVLAVLHLRETRKEQMRLAQLWENTDLPEMIKEPIELVRLRRKSKEVSDRLQEYIK
jgi:hypothetical protein